MYRICCARTNDCARDPCIQIVSALLEYQLHVGKQVAGGGSVAKRCSLCSAGGSGEQRFISADG